MSRWTQIFLLVGASVLAGAVLLLLAIDRYRSLPENVIVRPVGQEVRYDDFAFAVLGSREAPELAPADPAQRTAPRFILVSLRVANYAQRVDFRFRPSTIRRVDDHGVEFRPSPRGVGALRRTEEDGCADPLPPGTDCRTSLVFEVPSTATGLRARVGTVAGVLDLLDRVLYGKQFLDLN